MKFLSAMPFLAVCLSPAASGVLWAGDPPAVPGLKATRLYVVASENMLAGVNPRDAIASMSIWIKQLGKMRGFDCEYKVDTAVSLGQVRQRLKEHTADLLVLDTPDYLSLGDEALVEAIAVGTNRGQLAAFPYLLLSNDAAGADPLAGLRGKRIIVASRTKSNTRLVWLDTLVAENCLGRAASFFSSVELSYHGSSCILPLFFGKIDACVVDSNSWESVKELNPQLGRLKTLARSEAFLEGLLAMPVQFRHPYQSEVVNAILTLHKTLAGEQLGVVFKAGPQVPAEKAQFESVRALWSKYRRLVDTSGDVPGSTARRPEETAGKEGP
ncbi:MAG: PhnD/SsuA/transferrin family substrate-binding protein [Candidatus Solibacter sp.]